MSSGEPSRSEFQYSQLVSAQHLALIPGVSSREPRVGPTLATPPSSYSSTEFLVSRTASNICVRRHPSLELPFKRHENGGHGTTIWSI